MVEAALLAAVDEAVVVAEFPILAVPSRHFQERENPSDGLRHSATFRNFGILRFKI